MQVIDRADGIRVAALDPLPLRRPAKRPIAVPEGMPGIWSYRGYALMAADFVIVMSTFLVAYYLRFHVEFLAIKHIAVTQVDQFLKGAVLLAAVWVFFIWRDSGYDVGIRGIASPIVRIRSLLLTGTKSLVVLMVVSYLYRDLLLSRQVYLMTGVMAFCAMTFVRLLFRELDRDLASQGLALQRVMVAGADAQTEDFARRLRRAGSTLKLTGFLSTNGFTPGDTFANHPVFGRFDDLEGIYDRYPFENLVIGHSTLARAESGDEAEKLIKLLNFCEAKGISLHTLPNVLNVAVTKNEVSAFSGIPIVRLRDAALRKGYAVEKRILDLALASIAVVAGAPLWLLIALLVKLTSRGPVLFSQVRIGLHGKPFRMYKFRSMVADAEARLKDLVDMDRLAVPGFKIKGDPRVTPIGRFLRRTSLDEIPQLINVLKGEMGLVGPRPELPQLVQRYDAWQRRRLKAKPGITGYQQVMARGVPLAAAIEYDLIYLKHQSVLLDIYIMLKTVQVVLMGKGVTH
jgi:exopolysaccharide biosynthesis polyprenyl glycosylphosphotransferase